MRLHPFISSVHSIAIIFLLVFSIAAGTQNNWPVDCPKIVVSGPAGVVVPGETFVFSATLTDHTAKNLHFFWVVNDGEIVSGQYSLVLKARLQSTALGKTVMAAIKVWGLPVGCPDTASDTFMVEGLSAPINLGEVGNPTFIVNKGVLRNIGKELRENPNSQLFVIVSIERGLSPGSRSKIKNGVLKQLSSTRIDPSRFTIVETPSSSRKAVFWRIPPGTPDPYFERY